MLHINSHFIVGPDLLGSKRMHCLGEVRFLFSFASPYFAYTSPSRFREGKYVKQHKDNNIKILPFVVFEEMGYHN